MARLTTLPNRLKELKSTLGSLPAMERGSDAERTTFAPWRRWYKTARWQALRMVILTRDLFTCQWPGCGRLEPDTSQLVADHREPHRGNERLFWDERNLWTLCKPCHDSRKQRAERAAQRRHS